ncbi:MAG: TonB family protein [Planctomycetes bacterium]|nr:TonB family protein [Planctomycetota bacterium]
MAVVAGAMVMTLTLFMVLPLLQAISKPPTQDVIVQNIDTAEAPPPPPPPPEEPKKEEEQEEKPPELTPEAQPMDLQQLAMALNPGIGDGWGTVDISTKLNTIGQSSAGGDGLFSMDDLDQKPRAIYQPGPLLNTQIRKKAPGTVYIIFIVDASGRVQNPIVQKSSDPVFDQPALNAVKQWKFEPGKRNGESVRFRMRVPITFPKE